MLLNRLSKCIHTPGKVDTMHSHVHTRMASDWHLKLTTVLWFFWDNSLMWNCVFGQVHATYIQSECRLHLHYPQSWWWYIYALSFKPLEAWMTGCATLSKDKWCRHMGMVALPWYQASAPQVEAACGACCGTCACAQPYPSRRGTATGIYHNATQTFSVPKTKHTHTHTHTLTHACTHACKCLCVNWCLHYKLYVPHKGVILKSISA